MKPIIRIQGLGKYYKLGARARYGNIRESITNSLTSYITSLRSLGRTGNDRADTECAYVWALRDVSFDIMPGEALGVIGRNGAGKSTLLKILSRITEPTEGRVDLYGRVGSLLEVGTGFHPELTGRENIYLSAAILGMKRLEIERKFDEIVAFAEIEQFIDTPVKHYSSGMYVRLAFAVAAHLEPEILLIDEVLAVGDAPFQKKCLGKMDDVAKAGRTVVFVSHNMAAVQQLTARGILLQRGTVEFAGATAIAVEKYLTNTEDQAIQVYQVGQHGRRHSGLSQKIEFVSFELREHVNKMLVADQDLAITVTLKGNEDVSRFRLSITIFAADGTPVGSTFGPENLTIRREGYSTVEFRLVNPRLGPGAYYCGMGVGTGNHTTGHTDFDVVLDVVHFEVLPPGGDGGTLSYWTRGWGMIRFPEAVTGEVYSA
jgi:homopolymeric O-antigen transport system ATP-binding protein